MEAWIALGAYPKNLCPIVDHHRDVADGYYNGAFFGLDDLGRLILRVATNGRDEELVATQIIPVNKWTHVACSYDGDQEIAIFLNGEEVGRKTLSAPVKAADPGITSMLIARSRNAQRPYGTIRPEGTESSQTFIDGIMDELKIYNIALQPEEVAKSFAALKTDEASDLPARILPSGPKSDKKSKYSSVKIVESNDARVVVQWRYAIVDVLGTFAFEDPVTGWGDWTNETFTIYPDMVEALASGA